VIGTNESYKTESAYPYLHFADYYTASVTPSADVTMSFTATSVTFTSSYAEGYDATATPWILADSGIRLCRFVHKSHGFKTNKDVKISFANITKESDSSKYSTFDVLVRKWNDTDRTPSIIEQFAGVIFNPDAPNYIGKVIGDKYTEYDETISRLLEHGDFVNKSNYVRVEIADGVSAGSISPNLIPAGYEAIYEPIAGFTGYHLPAAATISSNSGSSTFSGFDYAKKDNINYLNPIPTEAGTGSNVAFAKAANENKFTVPFQGGTDGTNFAIIKKIGADIATDGTNVFGFDLSNSDRAGTAAYEKALDILANPEEFSFDLLALPGVLQQYHSAVTILAESLAEERTDCVYIRDLTGINESVATALDEASAIDSSYSATYFPWIKVRDIGSNKDIYVPPSVIVPQAYVYNDNVAAEWFAPAGINRGTLGGAIDTRYRLYKADRDALYSGGTQHKDSTLWGGVMVCKSRLKEKDLIAKDSCGGYMIYVLLFHIAYSENRKNKWPFFFLFKTLKIQNGSDKILSVKIFIIKNIKWTWIYSDGRCALRAIQRKKFRNMEKIKVSVMACITIANSA